MEVECSLLINLDCKFAIVYVWYPFLDLYLLIVSNLIFALFSPALGTIWHTKDDVASKVIC